MGKLAWAQSDGNFLLGWLDLGSRGVQRFFAKIALLRSADIGGRDWSTRWRFREYGWVDCVWCYNGTYRKNEHWAMAQVKILRVEKSAGNWNATTDCLTTRIAFGKLARCWKEEKIVARNTIGFVKRDRRLEPGNELDCRRATGYSAISAKACPKLQCVSRPGASLT